MSVQFCTLLFCSPFLTLPCYVTRTLSIEDRIIKELGKGTFGSVYKCFDSKHNDHVALKIIRSIKRYIDSAKIEADILDDIYDKQHQRGVNLCVKMYSHFRFEGTLRFFMI